MTRFLTFRTAVIALLAALVGVGLAVLAVGAGKSRGAVEIMMPTSSPRPAIGVYVTGAVARPGVYSLQQGDRVADAVQAAGGLTPDADGSGVNLAQHISDEQHIRVPRIGESPPVAASGPPPATGALGTPTRLNVNTATQAELEGLPGVGPVTARAIIDYRTAKGPFQRVEDLLNVPRIGEATVSRLRPLVSVQ